MSLEQKIEELTEAITTLTTELKATTAANTEELEKAAKATTSARKAKAKEVEAEEDDEDEEEEKPKRSHRGASKAKAKAKAKEPEPEEEDEAEEEEDDLLGDDDEDEDITADQVKDLAKKCMAKGIDRADIKKLVTAAGAASIAKLDQSGRNEVYKKLLDL